MQQRELLYKIYSIKNRANSYAIFYATIRSIVDLHKYPTISFYDYTPNASLNWNPFRLYRFEIYKGLLNYYLIKLDQNYFNKEIVERKIRFKNVERLKQIELKGEYR